MNPFFDKGKLYKPVLIRDEDTVGHGVVEVPPDSDEYKELYALIERNPRFHEEAHWEERPK